MQCKVDSAFTQFGVYCCFCCGQSSNGEQVQKTAAICAVHCESGLL